MSERAHPDHPGFRDRWGIRLRKGYIPWVSFQRSPYKAALVWRYEWVDRYCHNCDVLDMACGMGWGTSLLHGKTVVGVDISKKAIAEAKGRYGARAAFAVGDMRALAFPDESFDVVACMEGIEHVPIATGRAFIAESARVLRSDGLLLLSSPTHHTLPHSGNPHHVKEYTPEEIVALLAPYYDVLEVITRDLDDLHNHFFRARRRSLPSEPA